MVTATHPNAAIRITLQPQANIDPKQTFANNKKPAKAGLLQGWIALLIGRPYMLPSQ
jgi:hypothetical protein